MSAQPAIMTIDFGLTNCKLCLFSFSGEVLAQAGTAYPTLSPRPEWSEQDPAQWEVTLRACSKRLWHRVEPSSYDVRAISITAHMHAVLAVDRAGKPLTNCLTLFDRRAQVEAEEIHTQVGEGYAYRVTGGRLEAYTPAAKILWFKKNLSDVFTRVAKFLPAKDYLRMMLGGEAVTDPIDAAGMLLFDLLRGSWDPTLTEAAGISMDLLPEVRLSTAYAGSLNETGADVLGLLPGIPLITGAGDDVEVLGAGAAADGLALEHIGTTGTWIACMDRPVFDPHQVVELYPHPIPGLFLLGGATNAAGLSLDWARRLLYADQPDLAQLPLDYPRGNPQRGLPVYLPFIRGERGLLWKSDARGAFLHMRDEYTREDLAQAVYEGVLFSMKEIQHAVNNLGVQQKIIISGSPVEYKAWNQMRADAYCLPLVFPSAENLTGLGAAMLAMLFLEVYPDFSAAVQACCQERIRLIPDSTKSGYFDERFHEYLNAIRNSTAIL